jgi:hypothetical protein
MLNIQTLSFFVVVLADRDYASQRVRMLRPATITCGVPVRLVYSASITSTPGPYSRYSPCFDKDWTTSTIKLPCGLLNTQPSLTYYSTRGLALTLPLTLPRTSSLHLGSHDGLMGRDRDMDNHQSDDHMGKCQSGRGKYRSQANRVQGLPQP